MAVDPLNPDVVDPVTGLPLLPKKAPLTPKAINPLPSSQTMTAPAPSPLPPPATTPPTLSPPRGTPNRGPDESYADWVARIGYDPFANANTANTAAPTVQPTTIVGAPLTPGINPPGDEGSTTAPTVPAPFTGDVKGFLEAKFGPNFNTLHAGSSSIDQILKYLNDNGIQATRATHAGGLPSDDKIIVNGRTIDLLLGGSSPEQTGGWTWNDITDNPNGPAGASQITDPATLQAMLALFGGASGAGGVGGSTGSSNITGNIGGSSGSSLLDQRIQELLSRSATPSATDPDIAKPIAANRLSEQRSFERDRQILAERNAAQGFGTSGGAETDLRGLEQDRAAREGQFEGQLYADRATQRIAELNQIISIYGNQLDAQTKNQIALEIAHLQADAQRAQLALNAQLGTGDLDLRRLALELSNTQANNALGFNYASLQEQANEAAYRALFGGTA